MFKLEIKDYLAPAPIKYDVGKMDISKAERNTLGDMVIDIIATKTKIELEWGLLTSNEVSELFQAIRPTQFPVKYFDPETAQYETKTFYKGDRSTGSVLFENGVPTWKGTKVNLIEI
nr:MAG TPA: hypothetical protein [Caudoviricetes sp.]